jgi:sulfur-carrier protein
MKIKMRLFAPFRELFGAGESEIELDGSPNVRELLDALCGSGEIKTRLYEDFGDLRSHVIVLINGKSIKALNGLSTGLQEGDEVALLPPISGG